MSLLRKLLSQSVEVRALDSHLPADRLLLTRPELERCRAEATRLGFRRLGPILETLRPLGLALLRLPGEVWVHESGTFLSLATYSYSFSARLTDGRYLLTWGHEGEPYRTHTARVEYSDGDLEQTLRAHQETLGRSGGAVEVGRDLDARVASVRRFYERDCPVGRLVGCLVAPLFLHVALCAVLSAAMLWLPLMVTPPESRAVLAALGGLMTLALVLLLRVPQGRAVAWRPRPEGLGSWRREARVQAATPRPALARCPFCHGGVEARDTSVCGRCLARHHDECWDAHTRCASCGDEARLGPVARRSVAA
ncbi:MAG: hypothetical protein AB7N76_31630 [Planctomycetota bacterium]